MKTNTMFVKLIIIQLFIITASGNSASKYNDVPSLIKHDGYPLEIHHVTTDDGYVLELHRIPYGRNETSSELGIRRVVLLAHCVFCNSASYVVLGPNGGLAYMLANNGYDVWMVNNRGTKYSRRHAELSPKSPKFWHFSWNEMGLFDIPSSIDYVLKETGESKLDLLGFSMGSVELIVMLSEKPEYNEKARSLTILAPAVFWGNSRSIFLTIGDLFSDFLIDVSINSGQLEVPSPSLRVNELFSSVCKPNIFLEIFCYKALNMAGGNLYNGNIDRRTLPFFFKFFPDSTSVRSAVHFYQSYTTGEFRKYNFGKKKNKQIYGSIHSPEYDLKKVTVPVNILWSRGDHITVDKDVLKLAEQLPNVVSSYEIPDKNFAHMDFVWAKNAHILVNEKVLEMLKETT